MFLGQPLAFNLLFSEKKVQGEAKVDAGQPNPEQPQVPAEAEKKAEEKPQPFVRKVKRPVVRPQQESPPKIKPEIPGRIPKPPNKGMIAD